MRSWACQMSQCSAVQSVSERMAWGRGVGGGVHWVILRGLQLAGVWGWWQCRAWGAVRCGVVVPT